MDYRMLKLPDFIHSAEDWRGPGKQSRTRSEQTGRGIQSPPRPKAVTACGGVVAVVDVVPRLLYPPRSQLTAVGACGHIDLHLLVPRRHFLPALKCDPSSDAVAALQSVFEIRRFAVIDELVEDFRFQCTETT